MRRKVSDLELLMQQINKLGDRVSGNPDQLAVLQDSLLNKEPYDPSGGAGSGALVAGGELDYNREQEEEARLLSVKTSDDVMSLQQSLNNSLTGYDLFGPGTDSLVVDGNFGPRTRRALYAHISMSLGEDRALPIIQQIDSNLRESNVY